MCNIHLSHNLVRRQLLGIIGILLFLTPTVDAKDWVRQPAFPRLNITDTIAVIEVPFTSAGASGDSCVWDFSQIQDICPHDFLIATTPSDTTYYAITKVNTRFHYCTRNDSVWQIGYDNNSLRMNYALPILHLTYPLTYQDTLKNTFVGHGEYCHLLPTSVHGQITMDVDGQGMLLLPHATLDSVVRVHTTQTLCEHVGDTLLSKIHHYQWFCPQIRYPLLETIAIEQRGENDTVLYAAAFYYQFADTLQQYVDSVVLPAEQDSVSLIFTEAQFLPNPVQDDLQISYVLTQAANISFSLHNNLGLALYVSHPTYQEAGEHSHRIAMGSYPQGTYVLYIHVNDIILSETIIKP